MSAPHTLESLRAEPNSLAPHYARFQVSERLLLTGHSHQAWPDTAREAQLRAWDDAALHVDDKWGRALAEAERVREGFAAWLEVPAEQVALGTSTHELVVRFLSALDLRARPRLVTTDGEFHTLRRQLDRLAEATHVEVVKVPAEPIDTLAERLAAVVDGRTSAVFVSAVMFGSSRIVPHLRHTQAACTRHGAALLVDTYHALGVLPYAVDALGLQDALVTGGGYKYLQLGEGNCFLRVPPCFTALPVVTGWFSEFARLSERPAGAVPFGEGHARWAGATYDPVSHYRAARVFAFFREQGLRASFLREVSLHQVRRLASRFDALALPDALVTRDRETPSEGFGGFLALRTAHAAALHERLRALGVLTDFRGDVLRLGPAPYVSDAQLDRAIDALGEAARAAT